MISPQAVWICVFAIVVYVVCRDENVYDWLYLQSRLLGTRLQMLYFRLRHHPGSPWVRYEVTRNANKMAKQLRDEFNRRS